MVIEVVLILTFGLFAVADWIAVERGDDDRRRITKPGATLALIAIAAVAGEMAGDARAALVVAVVLCLAGDVFLLGDDDRFFLAGLSAFALGHVAYVITALLVGVSWPRLAWAFPFLAVVLGVQAATGMLPGARRVGGSPMMIAVAVYSAIISAMVITATGTSSWLAAAGAMLFATSDSIIGYHRFATVDRSDRDGIADAIGRGARRRRRADLAVMTTYHLGQVLLILGLIAAG